MVRITANHNGIIKTLKISEWSAITGHLPQSIRKRFDSAVDHSNEAVVGLIDLGYKYKKPIGRHKDKEICKLYIDGLSQSEIGEKYNVSHERISQILRRNGIYSAQSGLRKAVLERRKKVAIDKGNRIIKIYKCKKSRWDFYRNMTIDFNDNPLKKYKQQRRNAKTRGIEWMFTIDTWWSVWEASGKYHLRGKSLGHYVMARKNDIGAYSVDNVEIKTCSENICEGYIFRGGKYKAS